MTVKLIDRRPCDVEGYLILNSFWGGKEKRRCVQLTTPKDYVQMTFDDARAFFKECIKKINEIDEKFNEYPPWWEVLSSSNTHETRSKEVTE